MKSIAVETASGADTALLGEHLARALRPGDVLAMRGDLGAGKTVMVSGIARGLKVEPGILVTSPTFVILHEYAGPVPLYHFDFYRLAREEEVHGLGYEEYFEGSGVCAVEWADKFPGLFGTDALWLTLSRTGDETRRIEISSAGLDDRAVEIAAAIESWQRAVRLSGGFFR